MTQLPDGIEQLLPANVIDKIYDDIAAPSTKEAGKIVADIVKTARLFLAPLQLTSAFQDRFANFIDRLISRVPEDRRTQAPAEIIGPAIQKMQFLEQEFHSIWAVIAP